MGWRAMAKTSVERTPGRAARREWLSAFDETLVLRRSSKDVPLLGRVLNGLYRIDSPLGGGGMGEVFLATQLSVPRPVVVKILHSEHTHDPLLVERFRREGLITGRLRHPNIVDVIDCGVDDGIYYLVLEYLDGPTLRGLIAEEGPLPEARIASLLTGVVRALSAMHEKGVVHRDLKPENIMITRLANGEEVAKVFDFGIAKLTDDDEQLTMTGVLIGTPLFMSPEQIEGGTIDHRADLYALGCIIHQMATGSHAFAGDSASSVLFRHLGPERPALQLGSAAFRALHRALIAKYPRERPATARAVLETLERIARAEVEPRRHRSVSSVRHRVRVRVGHARCTSARQRSRHEERRPSPAHL